MKKAIFFSILFLCLSILRSPAQALQIATLSHEGQIKSYSSVDALRQAYADAQDGDVITLSSGTFNSQSINKRITVRGAGMGVKVLDTDAYVEPTIISGNFEIVADGNETNSLVMEGLLCESRVELGGISNARFIKCRFTDLKYTTDKGSFNNTTYINCVFPSGPSFCYNATANLFGCYLKDPAFGSSSLYVLTNCVIEIDKRYITKYAECHNCIFIKTTVNQDIESPSYFSICQGPLYDYSPFNKTLAEHNNSIVPDEVTIFKDGTFYQLTDECKTKYLGSDGTQVGLYGGSLPFDPTPTNPQITKFNVASKTTADGKLSVDIEVLGK